MALAQSLPAAGDRAGLEIDARDRGVRANLGTRLLRPLRLVAAETLSRQRPDPRVHGIESHRRIAAERRTGDRLPSLLRLQAKRIDPSTVIRLLTSAPR